MLFEDSLNHEPVSVLIGENTRIHSQLLAQALRRDPLIQVAGAVCSAEEFLALARQRAPQVALLSGALDEDASRGLSTLREFHKAHPHVPAVVLLESCKKELVLEAFRSGARGIFSKDDAPEALCKCVLSVHAGQVWANSREVRFAIEALCASPTIRAVNAQGMTLLSPRELELVQYLAEGLTNRAIGARMGLSRHTVKNYLLRIFDKLGVSNRVELLALTLVQSSSSPKPQRETREAPPLLWCHYQADRGVPYAQLLLAEIYAEGRGIPQDPVSAYMWYSVSERMSEPVRKQICLAKERLAETLRPEQLHDGQQRAEEWLRRNAPPAISFALDPGSAKSYRRVGQNPQVAFGD
jgi:DNA-binding NarL/FixJ family response regulator